MILASSSLLVNCTSDPIQGPPGEDGIDGVDATTDCRACHSLEHREPIELAYSISGHATGTSWARGTSANCAQCHNNEGFADFQNTGAVQVGGYAVSNPITCTGCHDRIGGHRSFNFDTDGNDYALRTLAPVQLIIDDAITIDSKNDADVLGYSNTCVNCHQPRDSAPTDDDAIEGMFTIPVRFGPHHGPQSTMLEGLGGAEIVGDVDYPTVGAAQHKEGSSCVTCHMDETTDGTNGGHTWVPSKNVCTDCHDSDPGSVEGYEASKAALLVLLQANGVFDEEGELIEETEVTILNAKAAWNYIYLLEDSSEGIHNPDYAKALLANSIEALQNQ